MVKCPCNRFLTIRDISDDKKEIIPDDYYEEIEDFYLNKKIICAKKYCAHYDNIRLKKVNNENYEALLHTHIYHIINKYIESNNISGYGDFGQNLTKDNLYSDLYIDIKNKINVNNPIDWIKSQIDKYRPDSRSFRFRHNCPSFYWTQARRLFCMNIIDKYYECTSIELRQILDEEDK